MGWRMGIIIGSSIVLTIVGTFVIMKIVNIDLQRMSLGALGIAHLSRRIPPARVTDLAVESASVPLERVPIEWIRNALSPRSLRGADSAVIPAKQAV
jgi:hypothetical protein